MIMSLALAASLLFSFSSSLFSFSFPSLLLCSTLFFSFLLCSSLFCRRCSSTSRLSASSSSSSSSSGTHPRYVFENVSCFHSSTSTTSATAAGVRPSTSQNSSVIIIIILNIFLGGRGEGTGYKGERKNINFIFCRGVIFFCVFAPSQTHTHAHSLNFKGVCFLSLLLGLSPGDLFFVVLPWISCILERFVAR